MNDELAAIFDRIAHGQFTDADLASLRQFLESGDREVKAHFAKFNVNIGEGKDIHIGDRIYQIVDIDKILEILAKNIQKQNRDQLPIKTQQDYRNREILLNRVNRSCVSSLEQYLYHHIQINLGLEKRQNAVDLPWGYQEEASSYLPKGTRIIEQFDSLGVGRHLLILGQPGAGKTTALSELAKDLVKRAEKDYGLPIPVIFQLSTWKNPKQSLEKWLVAELHSKYNLPETVSLPWIENHQLLLLLDGLDEVCVEQQASCIEIINQFIDQYGQTEIVVCSRLDDYEKLPVQLRCDTALVIQPLNSEQIEQYFQDLQELSGANVDAIRSAVQTDPIMAELAKTPLFLWIMSLLYKGESTIKLPQNQNTEEEIKQLLFSQFLDRMAEPPNQGQRYPNPQINTNKKRSKQDKFNQIYSKEETLRWLQFLAKRLNQESNSVFLIEQLNPNWLPSNVSPWLYRLGVGLTAGLIMEWAYGLPFGLSEGLLSFQMLSGLIAGMSLGILSSRNSEIKLFDSLGWSWSWKRAFKDIIPTVYSIPVIATILLFASLTPISPPTFKNPVTLVATAVLTGLFASIISGVTSGFISTKLRDKDSKSITTNQGIYESAKQSIIVTFVAFLALIFPAVNSENYIPLAIVLGCIGLYTGGLSSFQHLILRILIWQTNNAPWNYTNFLNYITERLLVKRVERSYLFIHDLLRENLANQSNKIKKNKKSYSQGIILMLIGIVFLISVLTPININSWKVSSKQAMLYDYHINKGDRLITDLFFYRPQKLKLGDIIAFKPIKEMLYTSSVSINGEILGCPNDVVSIKEGQIMVNRTVFNEQIKMQINLQDYPPTKVPNNSYLIIAKKNNEERTSLIPIPDSHILEKVILRVWPLPIKFI